MLMGLQEIHASLRGGGGPDPTDDAFFNLLNISENSGFELSPSRSAWQWVLVQLFSVRMDEVKHAEEPSEAFAERVRQGFDRGTRLLASCKKGGIDQWISLGKSADVFIGGWLANEQFDLDIPVSFLAQCARLGLSISICTND
jgi:hypothetical protein